MPAVHFQCRVREVHRHSSDVASYVLDYAGRRPRFRPGQFVHLALDEYDPSSHWPDSRVFSIASAPGAATLRLTISRQGRYTCRILTALDVGHVVWCKGPYGEFEVRPQSSSEDLILIAGGTGITPFCAFMEHALEDPANAKLPAFLYYGARTAELLVYRDLASRWAEAVFGSRVEFFAEQGDGGNAVKQGRLDIDEIAARHAGGRPCRFYLSGPKAMIQSFRDRLTTVHRVHEDYVVVDAWD
jgi:ferredoxin-NADP reductase